MFVKNLSECEEFIANDGCHLKELLHPGNDSVDLPYSIAVARVEIKQSTFKHRLDQAEVYYILSGAGRIHIDQETRKVGRGDMILIPPGSVQWLENDGYEEIHLMAIVNPPWTKNGDVRID